MSDEQNILDASISDSNEDFQVASTGKRFLNNIIDVIGFYLLVFIVSIILVVLELYTPPADDDFDGVGTLVSLLCFFGYYFLFEMFTNGRTLGKFITKTKVVSTNKDNPTASDYAVRTVSRMIPFEAFSVFSSGGIMWHDSFSNTKVVHLNS